MPHRLPPLFAHRLGRGLAPDSSREGLALTLQGPADGLETDVCLSRDGELVLLHDDFLEISTTGTGWAHERDWAGYLDALQLRDRFGTPTSHKPLRLPELIGLVPAGMPLQVDVKAYGRPDLAELTARAIAADLRSRPEQLDRPVEALSFHAGACRAAAEAGLAARLVLWADFDPNAIGSWCLSHGVAGVCIEHFLLHSRLVEVLRSYGLSVTTGTINHAELALRAAALGVDAITTDDPANLSRQVLARTRLDRAVIAT